MAISMGGLPGIRLPGAFIEGPLGIPLYVESHGNPSALTRILLVHGGLQSCLCYQRQAAALAERGYYVVAPDLPWHGFSGPGPEQHGILPTPEILGESLAAVCLHCGLNEAPLILLGWSFGGLVIRSFLLNQRPDNIAGLAFVAALLDFDTFTPIAMAESAHVLQSFQRLASPGAPMPERFAALQDFVGLLWHRPPSAEEYYRVLGYNFSCFAK